MKLAKKNQNEQKKVSKRSRQMRDDDIAVIGVACRFPGAPDRQAFWENLIEGRNSIREIPPSRWDLEHFYSPDIEAPNKSVSKWCGLLDDIEYFDNRFFNISPREAKSMDPQQRILLEETWHCIEDASVPLRRLQNKTTSVHVGVMASDYHQEISAPGMVTDSYAALGNYDCILANRLSYVFGFSGPSLSVDAACASSLVALHKAKSSLLLGESDYALAAGVSLNFHPWKNISFSKSRMFSPDGQCKTFDKDANGYVPGEGIGVVLLQPLKDALAEGRHIYGLVKGSAVNHVGQAHSITAPRVEAQRKVILAAYADADINPESVTYVEAHGSGTSLGDPIEVESLTQAFRTYTQARQFCRIGTVKTNIGHLEASAGVAGVIKVLLMMRNRQIPKTLNVKTLNPIINFKHSPFTVAMEAAAWEPREAGEPLRAGVSSFGFGGANAHAVLESYTPEPMADTPADEGDQLFLLSARSQKALAGLTSSWRDFVKTDHFKEASLADMCHQLQVGRGHFPYRQGTMVSSKDELIQYVKQIGDCSDVRRVNGQYWYSTFGAMPWTGITQIKRLEAQVPAFAERLDAAKTFLESLDGGKQLARSFRRARWAKKNLELFRFLVAAAWFESFEQMGFQPKGIYGKGEGALLALFIAGMLSRKDVAEALLGSKKPEALTLNRPRLPFMDGTQTIKPFSIRPNYLKDLIETWSINTEDLDRYAEKARLLLDNQYTFKKYVSDWDAVLDGRAPAIKTLLEDGTLVAGDDPTKESQRKLLIIVIKSCLGKLNKKWDLASPKTVKIQRLHEILDLLRDEVMLPEDVVAALLSSEVDWSALVGKLNQRQDRLQTAAGYELLKQEVSHLKEVADQAAWLKELQQPGPMPSFDEKVTHLILGSYDEKLPEKSVHVTLEGDLNSVWLSALFNVWQRGAKLEWSSINDGLPYRTQDLPQYVYDRKPFWLNKTPSAKAKPSETSVTEKPAAMTAKPKSNESTSGTSAAKAGQLIADPKRANRFFRIVSGERDVIIKDTVVLGFEIVPSTLRLEMALDATRRLTGEPINTYRNLLFQNPGIVQGDYRLDVDIDPEKKTFMVSSDHGPLCQGKMAAEDLESVPAIDVKALMRGYSEACPEVYKQYVTWGYNYGPTLNLIEKAFDNEQAYAFKLGVVPITEGKGTGLDPHLLDCVFQSIFWAANRKGGVFKNGRLYVPFTVKSLQIFERYDMESLVVIPKDGIKILPNDDLLLDYQVYDMNGKIRLNMKDMLFKQVDREFLENSLRQTQSKLDVVVEPSGGLDIASLKPALTAYADDKMDMLLGLEAGMSQVEAFGRDLLLRTFQEKMGLFTKPGREFTKDSLRQALDLIPKYKRLLAALIELFTRQGYLAAEGEKLTVTPLVLADETKANLASVEARKQAIGDASADMKPFLNLLEVAVTHYPEVLSGKMTHLEVLFPKGSGALFENIYKNNGISDHYNCLVTLALVNYVVNAIALDDKAKVRILEVGSGTGGTSAGVLAALNPYGEHIEYTYTDISLGFVNFGKRTFGPRFPFAQFKVLDIEKSIVGQGFDFQGYDLVFETNCIHATRDVNQTAEELKRLLKPGGLLIINEISQLQDFWTLVAGLIDGWWLFKDPEPRVQHSPLLSYSGWRHVFEKHGYEAVFGVEETRQKPYEQAVILAASDGVVDRGVVETKPAVKEIAASAARPVAASGASLTVRIGDHLREIFAETLQMSAHEIETDGDFSEYGIDSMVVLDIIDRLEKTFGELPKTLLFENMTIASLATWFEKNHREFVTEYYASREAGGAAASQPQASQQTQEQPGKAFAAAVAPVPFASLEQAVKSKVITRADHLLALEQGMAEVEQFGRLLLLRELQTAGLIQKPGETFTQAEFAEKLSLIDKYQRLSVALINMLTKHGYISASENGFKVEALAASKTVQDHIKLLHERKENIETQVPTLKPFLNLLEVAVPAYTDILSGRKTHLEILFPKGSGAHFEFIYKGNDLSDYYNILVREALVNYVDQVKAMAPEQGVRILEIGSGTGGTSAGVLEALAPYGDMIEYYYTDISLGFTNFGKRTFGSKYPFAKFKPLDIEKDVLKQGFEFQGYDLVFETNCIHAVSQLDRSVREIKKLLKPDGLLIINEISQLQDFWTLVAGLIDGWWLFEDGERRIADSPLLGYTGWSNLFESHGFYQTFGAEPGREKTYEQAVIVSQSDGKVTLTAEEEARLKPPETVAPAAASVQAGATGEDRRSLLQRDLQRIFAETLEMRPDDIEPDGDFSEYGIDSMITLDLIDRLEKDFGELPKTLLFEQNSLASLMTYFEKDHAATLQTRYPVAAVTSPTAAPSAGTATTAPTTAGSLLPPRGAGEREPMAIVGLSGRYPKSPDLETLWNNLSQGRVCTGEVPADRWNFRHYYDADRQPGKAYTKWGGFLEDYDKFDALFFNIAPRQAELMDPQQRIFLETVWATLESAGHTRASLGSSVGVFVGVTTNTYGFYGVEQSLAGNVQCPDVDAYDIANRVSYFFDFNGPSMALDSACSSSLSALHLACQSVWRGECEAAIAGGVSLTLHPNRVLQFCSKNMLSATGKSMTFGEGANGFVDAEGVGAALIKPLSAALRDRDHVLGVIRGSSVNAGGRTHGYTVPNPNAQAALVKSALSDAGVEPGQIDYIEAHGTGTSLGDPIEIAGLKQVFGADEKRLADCPVGSIKTNIGHTIACAGMAGMTKVLLQMQHRQLVPSLNAETTNSFIDFKNAPFFIPNTLQAWQPKSGESQLRAGVSSFGAGGANAHVILESYSDSARVMPAADAQIMVFSAKTQANLRASLTKFVRFLKQGTASAGATQLPLLADMAYTLQVGRKPLPVRIAFVATNHAEVLEILTGYLNDRDHLDVFEGELQARRRFQIEDDEDGRTYIQSLIRKGKLRQLAGFWTEGIGIDWEMLDPSRLKRRVPLPTYAFTRERYWLPEAEMAPGVSGLQKLHPLIDRNTSDFEAQSYATRLTHSHFELSDHVIGGQAVLPAVAYIEMARAAGEMAAGEAVSQLHGMVWRHPIHVENQRDLKMVLEPDEAQVLWRISSEDESGETLLHGEGSLNYESDGAVSTVPPNVPFEAIRSRCGYVESADQLYQRFAEGGLPYGAGFQGIREICFNDDEALVSLELPNSLERQFEQYGLHPSLLDGALQGALRLLFHRLGAGPYLAFSLAQLDILAPLPAKAMAHVRRLGGPTSENLDRFDVIICDEAGQPCVVVREFTLLADQSSGPPEKDKHETHMYRDQWREASEFAQASTSTDTALLILEEGNAWLNNLRELMPSNRLIHVQPGTHLEHRGTDAYRLDPSHRGQWRDLLADLKDAPIQCLIHTPQVALTEAATAWPEPFGLATVMAMSQALLANGTSQRVPMIYTYQADGSLADAHHAAMEGFAQTLRLENPHLDLRTLAIETPLARLDQKSLAAHLQAIWSDRQTNGPIRFSEERCWIRTRQRTPLTTLADPASASFRHKGTYLITGGTGGIGFAFAKHLSAEHAAQITLCGRSPLSNAIQAKLNELQALGGEAIYLQADMAASDQVNRLITQIQQQFGTLHGWFHAAGVNRDTFIANKSWEHVTAVLAPKVQGCLNLDRATANIPLDFAVCFSSLAALVGNFGQADYAYANAFMDHFAAWREAQRKGGQRMGRTLSVNWPLWAEGGMALDAQTIAQFEETWGMVALASRNGIEALGKSLVLEDAHLAVVAGDPQKLDALLHQNEMLSAEPVRMGKAVVAEPPRV